MKALVFERLADPFVSLGDLCGERSVYGNLAPLTIGCYAAKMWRSKWLSLGVCLCLTWRLQAADAEKAFSETVRKLTPEEIEKSFGKASGSEDSADQSQVKIADVRDHTLGFRYLYALPRSSLAGLPRWSPTEGEAPLSPHKAASIAAQHLREYFPKSKLTVFALTLDLCGVGRDFDKPELKDIWTYEVCFNVEPKPGPKESALLNVRVLLDGTVVKPVITPLE